MYMHTFMNMFSLHTVCVLLLCYSHYCVHIICVCTRLRTCTPVCVFLFWLNYGFLISKSINNCVCGTYLAVKAACCL